MEPRVLLQKTYYGFESAFDIERDVTEAIEEISDKEPEFSGDITITITYKEEE